MRVHGLRPWVAIKGAYSALRLVAAPPVYLASTAERLKHHHVMCLVDAILGRANRGDLRDDHMRLVAFALLPKWYEESRVTEFTYGAHKQRVEDMGDSGRDKLRTFGHKCMDSLAGASGRRACSGCADSRRGQWLLRTK